MKNKIKKEKEQVKVEPRYLFHFLRSSTGGGESAKLEISMNVRSGEATAIVSKEIRQYFPLKELEKAEDLYERLTCGGGRRVYELEDLAHPYNPKST